MRLPRPSLSRALALWTAFAGPLFAAPAWIGPAKCTGCHDHEKQTTQWRVNEPAQAKGRAHISAMKRLDDAKAAGYAKAAGLVDAYDLKGSCVRCHATVFRGDANAGVSCESCHGPAADYLEPHQQKGSYAKALTLGMRDLRQKPDAIGRLCAECHRVADRQLVAAGHPDGGAWDAGAGLGRIAHWSATYDPSRVAAAARVDRRSPPTVAAAPSAPVGRLSAAPSAPAARPAAARPAEPWDWSQPVQALPSDYVPESAAPAAAPSAPSAPAAGPVERARPAAPAPPPPSIAEERPSVPVGRGPGAPAIAPLAAPAAGTPGPSPTGVADLVARRGRALRALESLLRRGARTPGLAPPTPPAEFAGPDSELLRLQEEALVLALQALRRP